MEKWRASFIAAMVAAVAAITGGCGNYQATECYELTEGGPIGKHLSEYIEEDKRHREDFVPQLARWYKQEKAKMPKIRRTCPTAEDFYFERINAESEAAARAEKEVAEIEE